MAEAQNKSIGILGGSFDPVHKGHLIISKIAIRKIKLKKLYWVVTKKNPFKKKAFFSLKERLFKTKKITKKQKNIEVLYLDKIVRSSKSIDAIKYIIKKNYSKKLYFLIGSDNLINFHKWKNWKKIVKIVKLVVFSRKGYDKRGKESIVAKYLNKKNIIFINNQHIKFSSTKIRKKINR